MGTIYTAVNEETMVGYELGKGGWVELENAFASETVR